MKNGAKRSLNKALNYVTGAALIVSLLVALSGCVTYIGEGEGRVVKLDQSYVMKDEDTGCEYFIIRKTLLPRIDKTGSNIKGCNAVEEAR